MPLLELTDEDIEYAERITGLSFLDPARRELLLLRSSIDIWACPGSGKTSLLVAKLAMLGRRWNVRHRGVCVLSHTNVAREEIEHTLARSESRALLSAPHFIGTIQSFIDHFLGIPASVARFDVRPWSIDTDKYEAAFENELLKPRYGKLLTFLAHKEAKKRKSLIRNLSFSTADASVAIDHNALNAGPGTNSFDQMVQLKESLARRGILSYEDMYSLAAWYVGRYPLLRKALAHRFPWVFIDEMQDTSAKQWRLLSQIFDDDCVVQRLGDNHQEIFDDPDEEGVAFPGEVQASIENSFRLSPSIASFVGKLTPGGERVLNGNTARADLQHGVIVFDTETVGKVLPFFAQQVLEQLVPIKENPTACAVGAIAKKPEPGKFPHSLGEYWSEFIPSSDRFVPLAESIAEHVQDSLLTVRATGNFGALVDTVLKSLSDVLRREGILREDQKCHTPHSLLRSLRSEHPEQFQRLVYSLTNMCKEAWGDPQCKVERMWRAYECALSPFVSKLSEQARRELREPPRPERTAVVQVAGQATNVYKHVAAQGTVDVELSTIHAIKGRTLDATLVVETKYITHDLSRVLRLSLEGHPRRPSANQLKQARRIYVGVSRPRYLLFLAVSRNEVKPSTLSAIQSLGWKVHDLTRESA